MTRRRGAATRAATVPASDLVQVFSGRTVIRAASPVRLRPFGPGGGWAKVGLSGLRSLEIPRRPEVARLFAGDAWFSDDGRLCRRRAISDLYEIVISSRSLMRCCRGMLDSGLTFELSDKGKYVQALLDRAPGLEELVSEYPALEVIQDLTRKRTAQFRNDLKSFSRASQVPMAW